MKLFEAILNKNEGILSSIADVEFGGAALEKLEDHAKDLIMKHFNDGCVIGFVCLRSKTWNRNAEIIGENQTSIRDLAK